MIVHFICPRLGLAATSRKVKANRLKVSRAPPITRNTYLDYLYAVEIHTHVEEQFFRGKKYIKSVG